MEHYYALIMAGGGGTRLWPLSRRNRPKQMLPLMSKDSMFRVAVLRLVTLFPFNRIFVVTGADQVEGLRADVPELPAENFILEPFGMDSGPAAGLGLVTIQKRDPQATIAILTADHHIQDLVGFLNALRAAHDVAQNGYVVTLGIQPGYPATGFGYIEQGAALQETHGCQAYIANAFKEKPSFETAQQFLEAGNYTWNSGMFVWRATDAQAEFERQQPAMATLLQTLQAQQGQPAYPATLAQLWGQMPRLSLDYAVMENAARVATIPVNIGWSDIGSWAAVYEALAAQVGDNVVMDERGNHVDIDTRGTLVHSKRTVVTIGLEDLVIVDTDDVLMICKRERAQDVRQAVQQLKDNALDDLL
ncbi:MAG: mannose-1-phosphate guanylyltransferase [Anaerolineae bacterium]|nr:mannose-1-phosphate guanylyltransferase [Anaerolineae bacterium]